VDQLGLGRRLGCVLGSPRHSFTDQHNLAPEAADRLRTDMHDHAGADGIHNDSAAWFVAVDAIS
jgi:hypothetical protein